MMRVHRLICTWLGIGYIGKGAGTVAAAICCLIWFVTFHKYSHDYSQLLLVLIVTIVGIWSAGKVETVWGKDSNRVVIDEVAGMGVSMLFLPVTWKYIVSAFILFRFFDIAKPLFIRRLERFPGGWGVMADDLLAGIYSNLIMQCIVIGNFY